METIKIIRTVIDKLPHTESKQVFYRDESLTGFGLYIGKTTKTYYCEKRINGRTRRVKLGLHGQITPEQARKAAIETLGKMTAGVDPVAEKKGEITERVTVKMAFEDFLTTRENLKERTVYDYSRAMNGAFKPWQGKRLVDITKDQIRRKHSALGEEIGHAQANQAMRFLRSLFSFAMGRYEGSNGHPLITYNPVRGLSETRAWYRVDRRRTIIKPHELPAWYQAVTTLEEYRKKHNVDVARDYILLVLFTGLRREEAARLKWDQIDFKGKTLTIPDTKNREPHTLPLSDFLFDLLDKRKQASSSEYVFPGGGATGHIVEPRKQMLKVIKASGVQFTVHDLRRTFITTAEGLDIPAYALKALLNHKTSGDVTQGYIVCDAERLRLPMQKITDKLLQLAGMKDPAKIIQLKQA